MTLHCDVDAYTDAATANSSTGHAHLSPCDDLPVEPSSSFTVSAEDQWAASLFIRDIFAGRIDRSAFLPECWPERFVHNLRRAAPHSEQPTY